MAWVFVSEAGTPLEWEQRAEGHDPHSEEDEIAATLHAALSPEYLC
jgi:hypothetical protein